MTKQHELLSARILLRWRIPVAMSSRNARNDIIDMQLRTSKATLT